MRKPIRIVLVAALAVVSLLALSAGGGTAAPEKTLAGTPIVIAMPLALTGIISFYDQPNLAGAQIAAAQVNKAGGVLGRPLKIISADTKSDLGLIAGVAQSLLAKKADLMIPTLDYDFGGPAARAACAKNIPAISEAGDSRYGLQGIGRCLFNQFPSGSEAAIGATWAWSKGWRHPYVLEDPSISYSKTFFENFKHSWGKLGGQIAGEDTFMNSDQSIASQITKMKQLVDQKKVDFIFMGSYAPGGASATKQIRAAGINLPIIGGAGFDGTFWLGAVPNLKNFYVIAGGVTTGGDPNKLRAAVYSAYKAKFKKDAPLGEQTLNGYSAVMAFKKAIERAKSTDGLKVIAQLEKFKNEPLPIGNITWTPKCHISKLRSLPIVTFVGTKEKFVAEVAPKAGILPKTLC
ncbi:MAG TPA: ABC transporter substrate-binding protein [Gaiellaceae bacterium]|nr:ABC transporter substrate-binding protein [Gaiellaceae bacterium]